DPRFIARRIAICAAEDIGLAHPNLLNIVNSAWQLIEKIGMPEARIILAQVAVLVAISPKSNSAYMGIENALADVRKGKIFDVPTHLKDASKDGVLGHGKNYKYPHDYERHFIKQQYLNNEFEGKYYKAGSEGQEKIYRDFLYRLWDKKNDAEK
ncbi:MAG: replication-associated recombination protein A, partial [Elusimicrobiota bacterium]|nr:replication-associated recombination protein A [Elusimicrobiota bacterium]